MTAWHREPMLAFDLETTGPHPDTARIVTAVLIALVPGHEPHVTEWLVNPGVPIPACATAIHGITTERARDDGQPSETAVFEITGRIALALGRGIPLVGMNLAYDLTVLDREARRHHIDTLSRRLDEVAPVIDIYVLDKQVDKYRKGKRTLSAMCDTYDVTHGGAHDAASDALAAARIAHRMAEQYPGLQVTPESLHDMQTGWRYEQSASLQAYFRKTDPTAVVNGDWPIQQLPDGWTPELVDEPEEIPA